jgi:drug/metabolite transporter (DMT)-like permease
VGAPVRPVALTPRAWAELSLLALIWGASFFSISIALREMGPLTAVLHRTFQAELILLAVVRLRGPRMPADARTWGPFAVMGLLNSLT